MKTTHELARELLQLPDIEVHVEGWTGDEPTARLSGYDPEKVAFICPARKFFGYCSKPANPETGVAILHIRT